MAPSGEAHIPTSIKRRMIGSGLDVLKQVLPRNRTGDKIFATIIHLLSHKRWPGRHPLFSDFLWRMKTNGELEDALRQFVSDKEFAKLYVKAVVGEDYVVPTYGVIRSEQELSGYEFPEKCVLKPTQGSGQVTFVTPGAAPDYETLRSYFRVDLYEKGRQVNYKNLKPKIMVEGLALGLVSPVDFKVFCYRGEPKFLLLDSKQGKLRWQSIVDPEWRPCSFRINLPSHEPPVPKPACLEEMLEVAGRLAQPFDLIRIDLFTDGERFVVGELTNCHASGAARFATRADEVAFSKALFS